MIKGIVLELWAASLMIKKCIAKTFFRCILSHFRHAIKIWQDKIFFFIKFWEKKIVSTTHFLCILSHFKHALKIWKDKIYFALLSFSRPGLEKIFKNLFFSKIFLLPKLIFDLFHAIPDYPDQFHFTLWSPGGVILIRIF